jgi:hypothetical protein
MILCHGFPVIEESAPARSRPTIRPIAHWVIWAGIPLMVIIAAAAIWSLLGVGRDQLDAIRTGGTLGVGLGGAVLLWLAIRRQRSTELDLLQKYEAHELAQRVADHVRFGGEVQVEHAAFEDEWPAELDQFRA